MQSEWADMSSYTDVDSYRHFLPDIPVVNGNSIHVVSAGHFSRVETQTQTRPPFRQVKRQVSIFSAGISEALNYKLLTTTSIVTTLSTIKKSC